MRRTRGETEEGVRLLRGSSGPGQTASRTYPSKLSVKKKSKRRAACLLDDAVSLAC